MASKFNFSIDQGVDNVVEITYAPNNVEFDLTGWTVTTQLRRTKESATVDLTLTSPADITIAAALTAHNFRAAVTAGMSGRYTYDTVAVNGSAKRKVCEGNVSVNPTLPR